MNTRFHVIVSGVVLFVLPAWTLAGMVLEVERDGQAVNNSLVSAQTIDGASFTTNMNPKVFGSLPTATITGANGGGDVDFFAFTAGPGTAYFDVDNQPSTFDSYLALFDADGTLLGDNDDSFPADPGSASDVDAFLGEIQLTESGTYYIVVAAYPNFANATFTGDDFFELTRPDGKFGGFAFANATAGDSTFDMNVPQAGSAYTLHITIPEPGMLMLLIPVVGIVMRKSTRR